MASLGVWFPAIRAGTGADVFVERLVASLGNLGIRAEISWLPHSAEFAPWLTSKPTPPHWANIAHVNTWIHPSLIPSSLPVVATCHHVVHDPTFAPYRSFPQTIYHTTWIKRIEKAVIRRATVTTAVSRYTATQAEALLAARNVRVIYNSVDTSIFSPGPARSPNRPFRLLYVGSWSTRKGVDLLPQVMAQLGTEYELIVVTDGAALRRPGTSRNNISVVGRLATQQQLIELLRSSDTFLFPSRLEGFGLAVLEAQACGLPVVASRSSALPEVVEDGVTGFLSDVDDVPGMVSRIRQMKEDATLRRRMSEAARQRVVSMFSEKHWANKYLTVYEGLTPG